MTGPTDLDRENAPARPDDDHAAAAAADADATRTHVRPAGPVRSIVTLAVLLGIGFGLQSFQSSLRTRYFDTSWYGRAVRPPWQLPNDVTATVWLVAMLVLAVGSWLAWREHRSREVLVLFGVQALLNAVRPLALFALYPLFGSLGIWLAAAITFLLALTAVAAILVGWRLNRVAAVLLAAYLAWTLFATSVVAGLAVLN